MHQSVRAVKALEDDEKTVAALGCLAVLTIYPVAVILRGYVLSTLWGWFLVPVFQIPQLTVVPAIGLSLIAGFLTLHAQVGLQKQTFETLSKRLVDVVLYPIMAFAIGWIVARFM